MAQEKEQIEHWLDRFLKLANDFAEKGDLQKQEYWKGQVMGICKVADILSLEINTSYYLRNLI